MKTSHLLMAAFAVALSSPAEALAPPPPTEQFVLAEDLINTPKWSEIYGYLQQIHVEGINTPVRDGNPLLVHALLDPDSGLCHVAAIEDILLAGPDIRIPDAATGNTPLHIVAMRNDYALALRIYGAMGEEAYLRIRNKDGKTPAELATEPHLKQFLTTGVPCELRSKKAKTAFRDIRYGSGETFYQFGQMYNSGVGEDVAASAPWIPGEEPLRDVAHFWMRAAAARGHAAALANLGMLHLWGVEGVEQDSAKAYVLLKEAADCGNTDAAELLADMQAPPCTTPPQSLPADGKGCTLTIKGERADNGKPIVVRKAKFRIAGYCVVTGSLAELSFSDAEHSFNGTILVEHVEGNNYTGRIGGTLECKGAKPVEVCPFTFELTVPTE